MKHFLIIWAPALTRPIIAIILLLIQTLQFYGREGVLSVKSWLGTTIRVQFMWGFYCGLSKQINHTGNSKACIVKMKENPCFLKKSCFTSAQREVKNWDLMLESHGYDLLPFWCYQSLTGHFLCMAGLCTGCFTVITSSKSYSHSKRSVLLPSAL